MEKPAYDEVHTNLVNSGVYVLEREVLDMIPKGREVSLEREIFPRLQKVGELRAYVSSAYWCDIGIPERYLTASRDVLSGVVGRTENFEDLSIHPSVQVSEDATMLPPVSIAEGCKVGACATVGSRTSLGKGCVIEKHARVEGSVLFENVRVGKGAVIRDSIVGPGTVVHRNCIIRGLSVLGAECVIEEENVLDNRVRMNPRARLSADCIRF